MGQTSRMLAALGSKEAAESATRGLARFCAELICINSAWRHFCDDRGAMRFYQLQFVQEGARVGIGWVGDEDAAKRAIAQWTDEESPAFTYEAVEIEPTKEGILFALNRLAAR